MNTFDLSRNWFNFCFDNPEKIKPNHTAVYFFAIEHCNRLGWKEKFGFPTTMVMEAIGIKSYNTYINTLHDIVEFGFIEMIETSKNQYSANIIALSKFDKALNKALDKAFIKHGTKQSESTSESIVSINKQETKEQKNKKQLNKFVYDVFPKGMTDDKEFVEAFIDFEQVRSKKKATISERAYKTLFNSLDKLCDGDLDLAIKIIDQSSQKGYPNFYALPKENKNK